MGTGMTIRWVANISISALPYVLHIDWATPLSRYQSPACTAPQERVPAVQFVIPGICAALRDSECMSAQMRNFHVTARHHLDLVPPRWFMKNATNVLSGRISTCSSVSCALKWWRVNQTAINSRRSVPLPCAVSGPAIWISVSTETNINRGSQLTMLLEAPQGNAGSSKASDGPYGPVQGLSWWQAFWLEWERPTFARSLGSCL